MVHGCDVLIVNHFTLGCAPWHDNVIVCVNDITMVWGVHDIVGFRRSWLTQYTALVQ